MDPTSVILGLSNISCGVLFVIISIPLLKKHVKMNRIYGVRFKKSFESEESWYKINQYGAKRLITWSVPLMLIGIATFFVDFGGHENANTTLVIAFACAPLIVIIPAIESYCYARKL